MGAKLGEQMDIGTHHAAVQDVADHGDAQAFQGFLVAQDGVGVKQAL